MEYFVLDGYVTEYIQMIEDIQNMYKHMMQIEENRSRKFGMMEKRIELVEPILLQLNPKAYKATWEKLLVISAEVYNDMFDHKFHDLFVVNNPQKMPKPDKIQAMNVYGQKSIELYE